MTSPSRDTAHLCCEGPHRSTSQQGSLLSKNPPTLLRSRGHPPSLELPEGLRGARYNESVGSGAPDIQGTDLLEDLRAEPGQNLDTVLGEVVDHTLPLPMADHAEVAA